jgi:2-(1,2-epoxy-1,2-dihydrophenyl)acetyl-CoA isomerase
MSSNGTPHTIKYRDEAQVRIITLNRPERKNALNIPMRASLAALVNDAHTDSDVRAIVLTGAGGTFCSGADVIGMEQQKDLAKARARVETAQAIARSIGSGPTPVIAAVEGAAFGAGLAIALACDYIVATPDVRLSAAFVNVGLSGDAGILFSLPRRVGPSRARAMMMLAQTVGGIEALRIGLVDELTEPGQSLVNATGVAIALAARPPLAIAAIKRAFAEPPASLEHALAAELGLQAPLLGSEDFLEAITAFKDKRKPTFTGT